MVTAGILAMFLAVDWTPCRLDAGVSFPTRKAQCTTIAVPVDPEDDDASKLELFAARISSLQPSPEPDPLLIIAGGPGQSASEFFVTVGEAFEPLRRNRDIILIDQRGTGRSSPLNCVASDRLIVGDLDPEEIGSWVRQCVAALPKDPRFFTTSVAVRDLEYARELLGVQRWNVYGVSYGSRVARHYLQRFPDRVRSMVLDGVVARDRVLGSRAAIFGQKTLNDIFDRCQEDKACSAALGDSSEQLGMLLSRLDGTDASGVTGESSIDEPGEFPIDADQLRLTLQMLAYRTETQAMIPLLIKLAAVDGNPAPIAVLAKVVAKRLVAGLSDGMYLAVVCSEDLPELPDDLTTLRAQLQATSFGSKAFDVLRAVCTHWPRGRVDNDFREPVHDDAPTLILSGEFDPITPPSEASSVLAELPSARHVIATGQGHGVIGEGCLPEKVAEFVEVADAAGVDFACVERLRAFPLMLDLYGPAP